MENINVKEYGIMELLFYMLFHPSYIIKNVQQDLVLNMNLDNLMNIIREICVRT